MRDASGRSKGCGIVEYRTPMEAQQAINTLLDTELKGRLIFVREDREAAGEREFGRTCFSNLACRRALAPPCLRLCFVSLVIPKV